MANERVMIVEDEHIVALDIRNTIEGFGFVASGIHASGEDCLANMEEEKPDLVLMDFRLSGALDGGQTATRIREEFKIPVVMLTAFADENTLDRAKASQPFAYVIKPFEPRELRTAMVMSLYRHTMEKTVREQEERLRRTEKMEALGRLTGGIAHDFNNLLTVIMGHSRLIKDEVADLDGSVRDQVLEDLDGIQKAAMKSAALTRQLLSFSLNQRGDAKPINLNVALDKMEGLLRQLAQEDVHLVVDTSARDPVVVIDPSQLEQIVMNLVVNARHAMPDGGTLTITTAYRDVTEGEVIGRDGVSPGTFVELTVRDTGCGMDDEVQSRIFDPFFTTRESGKGTGLGLSTVYGVVRQSGGFVDVQSELGRGTVFAVCLPAHGDAPVESENTGDGDWDWAGEETVLLVEDDEPIRTMTARLLRRGGYTVLECSNPGEALLRAEDHSGIIHLVLSDVVMPLMTGVRLVTRLRENRPEMKAILMSGYPESALSDDECAVLGCEFLSKPIEPSQLGRRIRAILDG